MQISVYLQSLLILIVSQSAPPPVLMIPTSDVIEIAQKVAKNQGYEIRNRKLYYFDLMSEKEGPRLPGYISVGFYANDHLALEISINKTTGQVLDATHCYVFEYPDLADFGREIRRLSGSQPLTHKELTDSLGCPSMKTFKVSVRPRK